MFVRENVRVRHRREGWKGGKERVIKKGGMWGKGELWEMLAFVSVIGRVCATLCKELEYVWHEIGLNDLTRQRGVLERRYRWLSGTCFKTCRCMMWNFVCERNSIREVLAFHWRRLRYTLETSLRCTHLSESIVIRVFSDFNSHFEGWRGEEGENKGTLFQRVRNLLQLFDDRYKRKVFR